MSRRRRTRSNGSGETDQYIPLPYTVLHHPAWRSLSGAAVKVFLELRSRFNGKNNGDLHLSLDEGARLLGIGKSTIARAFEELQAHGFIRLTRQGEWKGRRASRWRVTDKGCDGHMPTRDWTQWRPAKKVVPFIEYLRAEQAAAVVDSPVKKQKSVLRRDILA